MNSKKITLLLPSLIVALVVILLMMALNNKGNINATNLQPKPFPAFTLTDLKSEYPISEKVFYQQPVTLLNVWASWCVVCKQEHPFLLELASQGIHIVGLNYRDDRQTALSQLHKRGDPYQAVIFDPQGNLALDLGVIGTPESYLITQQGIIISRFNGPLTQKVWSDIFAPSIDKLKKIKGN